jgi:L-lysine 2,3-aminomutase
LRVNCRYCFRRHFPYGEENAGADRWLRAIAYLREDPSITEVLLSGGDPLSLSNERLRERARRCVSLPQLRRRACTRACRCACPGPASTHSLEWVGLRAPGR